MPECVEIIKADNETMLQMCLAIRREVFVDEQGVSESIEVDEYDTLSPQCEHFLIGYNGENVGATRCLKLADGRVKLQRFCFRSCFRGKNLGRRALGCLEELYRQAGVAAIVLDAQWQVRDFYAKCGYKETSDIFMEAGMKHVKMEKELSLKSSQHRIGSRRDVEFFSDGHDLDEHNDEIAEMFGVSQ